MGRRIKKLIPYFLIQFYHYLIAFLKALFNRFPSRKMKVIGVTGTNGKSTTVKLISSILKEAGYKVASLSSIDFEIDGKREENLFKMTMPGRGFVHSFLRRSLKKGCTIAVIEVTSEGIKQYRHKFVNFDIAVFTNLSPEHIEAHGGFENYKKAKGELFKKAKELHILNTDDFSWEYFKKFPSREKIGYGTEKKLEKSFLAKKIKTQAGKSTFSLRGEEFTLNLPGKFNIYNALAAISLGDYLGISFLKMKEALEKVEGIPGRMEKVISSPFLVFVDYAFTPNALEKVYLELKENYNPSKIIAILGACGGGRDKWKREVLGEIAGRYADLIIVTDEDPYDEDPKEIIDQVALGVKQGEVLKIVSRREAIRKGLERAQKNDIVIITGKGNEPWMCLKDGKKIPWDDRQIVREEYEKTRIHQNQ